MSSGAESLPVIAEEEPVGWDALEEASTAVATNTSFASIAEGGITCRRRHLQQIWRTQHPFAQGPLHGPRISKCGQGRIQVWVREGTARVRYWRRAIWRGCLALPASEDLVVRVAGFLEGYRGEIMGVEDNSWYANSSYSGPVPHWADTATWQSFWTLTRSTWLRYSAAELELLNASSAAEFAVMRGVCGSRYYGPW